MRFPKGVEGLFFAPLRGAEPTWIEYPELRHEIFNEVERAQVLGDLSAWLAAQSS